MAPAPGVFGGDLSLTGDLSYILKYDVGAFQILNIPYSVALRCGRLRQQRLRLRPGGQRIYQWRGSITANFKYGKHNFNWTTRAVAGITNSDVTLIDGSVVPSASRNANTSATSTATSSTMSAPTRATSSCSPLPPNAGTGLYGSRNVVNGNIVYGYNPCLNTAITNGEKLSTQFFSAFTYRVTLPHDVDFTLTIDNVFNTDPAQSRDTLNYDSSSSGGPLGRTYQVSVRKTF